jgi:very-short-patch-repair endonuclease
MTTFYIAVLTIILIVGVALIVIKVLQAQPTQEEKSLPYRAKQYLFSRSEHEFLRVLQQKIDTNRYLIFPKVRLADFIEVTVNGNEYQGWWNKIKSKHIDFLVWDVQSNKISLAIELDGKSHGTDKMQERDEFVNKLYKQVGVRLERVQVGSDFATEIEKLSEFLIK